MTIIDENEIARCVRRAVEDYLKDLDGEKPHPLYGMVIHSVEKPLVELVMKYSKETRLALQSCLVLTEILFEIK